MRISIIVIFAFCLAINSAIAFKKSKGIPGGFQEIDLSNPPSDFNKIVSYAKLNFHKECNNNAINSGVQLSDVERASVQVVAGLNYDIVFRVLHYCEDHLTIRVFEALPDNNGVRNLSISSCK